MLISKLSIRAVFAGWLVAHAVGCSSASSALPSVAIAPQPPIESEAALPSPFPTAIPNFRPREITLDAGDVIPASFVDHCGAGFTSEPCFSMTPSNPRPGEVVLVEVVAPRAEGVGITAFGRELALFPVGDRFRAVIGVPLVSPPADHAMTIRTLTSDGASDEYRCAPASVRSREFRSDQLKVARGYAARSGSDRSLVDPDEVGTMVAPLPLPLLGMTPFVWPKSGQLNATFGDRRLFNGRLSTRHLGIDVSGVEGDRIFATQEGVVRLSSKVSASGETMIIDHGGGVMSHYLHMSKRLKGPGQYVRQGEVIGLVGRTGRVTGPHLHFAMSVHGRYVDPEQVLAQTMAPSSSFGRCEARTLTTSAR